MIKLRIKGSDGLHLLVDSSGLKFLGVNGKARNISLNIVDNGVNCISA